LRIDVSARPTSAYEHVFRLLLGPSAVVKVSLHLVLLEKKLRNFLDAGGMQGRRYFYYLRNYEKVFGNFI
jgi:hypothetical protein